MIEDIIKYNSDILKGKYEKINVGFTNTLYKVDKYIVKICEKKKNEKDFKHEIDFYQKNPNNKYIPTLYRYDLTKTKVKYCYSIIELLEGVSLYNIWHLLDEKKREEIIKKLCDILKTFHINKGQNYNWSNKLKKEALKYLKRSKDFYNKDEQKLIEKAISKFDKYLIDNEMVFIHNDIHFDNIIYNNGNIKIIDFERSMYAPLDFELDILYRMIRMPWKFASEETEQYTKYSDYENITLYLKKYYPLLFNHKYITERLKIYEMIYFMEPAYKYPHLPHLKQEVISTATYLVYNLDYDKIKTPKMLMNYMNAFIRYGWLDKNNIKHVNTLKDFRENYKISDIDKIFENNIGTCIEQVKFEKYWFDNNNIENKIFCHRSYETEENFLKEVRIHCFLLYKHNNYWYHFEHSNIIKRGIHKYKTVNEALKSICSGYNENDIRELTEIPYMPDNLSFKEFNLFVNKYPKIKKEDL